MSVANAIEVHQHAGHTAPRQFPQVPKPWWRMRKTRILDARCLGHRFRVLVERDQPALRSRARKDRRELPAAPEGRVHVGAAAPALPGRRASTASFNKTVVWVHGLFHCAPQNEKSWNTSGISPWVASASLAS